MREADVCFCLGALAPVWLTLLWLAWTRVGPPGSLGRKGAGRLARAWTQLRRAGQPGEVVRSHWFAQCYGWRVTPEVIELRAWAGPGVWVGLLVGAALLIGALSLSMVVPAMSARFPGDVELEGWAKLGVALRAHPCLWATLALAAAWTAIAWAHAIGRVQLLVEGPGPLHLRRHGAFRDQELEVPRGQFHGLERDETWLTIRVGPPGAIRQEVVLVAIADAELVADAALLDRALRERLGAWG